MKFRSLPYRVYNNYFYSGLQSFRGSTFIRNFLFSIAESGIEEYQGVPEGVFEREDWDNLIVLDACRYDFYQSIVGESEKRVSKAAMSGDYLVENFQDYDVGDIVYISANPFFTDEMMRNYIGRSDIFHEKFDTINTDWNEEVGVTLPDHVTRDAITAQKLFPAKKKIIHYMQPHRPYLNSKIENKGDVFRLAELGKIKKEEVRDAYRDNLRKVLKHVEELTKVLSGKTVVTADHGELLGENGMYGHVSGGKSKALREVPWDVIEESD